jgi:alpha-L-fucosidase
MQVFQGNAIGHKRIDHFAPVTASRVRLNILSSSAEAHIREFQLFESKGDSKEDAKDASKHDSP